MSKNELLEKWEELFIRFNTAPKLYQKIDFLKLLKFLKELIGYGGGGVSPDDFKTINGESILGTGNIEIKGQVLNPGNALKIEDIENSDEKLISVTSHIYDENINSSSFGENNTINGINSIAIGTSNEVSGSPIEFIGYCKAPNDEPSGYHRIPNNLTLVPHNTDENDREFHYKLLSEQNENEHQHRSDIPDLVGSTLYADEDGAIPLGVVTKSMYAYGNINGEHAELIFFELDQYPTAITSDYLSVWRRADATSNSIVQGFSNIVTASNAHAEGKDTEALKGQAHSEGEFTVASGTNSHSEGQYTTAFGIASHAEGEGGLVTLFRTLYDINNSNRISIYIQSSTDSDFGSDSALSFLAGSDFLSDSDSDGVLDINAIEKGKKINGWIGRPLYLVDGSLIGIVTSIDRLGRELTIDRNITLLSNTPIYIKTSATGEDSHTEGFLTDASGVHSHAEGERTQATGTNAHAEGFKTRAFGADSHAEGYGTAAYTFGAHAEGKLTQVEGEYSHTEGIDTKASGNFAHGEGKSSSADGNWSHAEGEDSLASGQGSHAEGIYCNALGAYSHAEGYNTSTEGNFEDVSSSDHSEEWQVAAHAEGKDTQAAQTASHSEGINTRADGDAAHAEGVDSKSLSIGAHAEGINTFVNEWSEGSHTEGYETQTDSNYSHAEGWKTFVQSKEEFVNRNAKIKLKSYNSSTHRVTMELVDGDFGSLVGSFHERKNSVVEIEGENRRYKFHNFIYYDENEPELTIEPRYPGNWNPGTNEDKSFILFGEYIQDDINEYPNDVYQVNRLEYTGYGAHAEGGETYTEGTYAHAEGEHTKALNRGAHSEGFKTQAKEKYSHSEGWYTKATHKAEHAEGRCNKSNDVHINTTVEYVDLDLPSGNLWATCNIGATNPEDYGDYYAWGETETKETYDWSTYKWCNGADDTLTKYCTSPDYWDGNTPNPDGLTRLVLEDDIAAKTLGENWRIPSKKDFEELIEHTDNLWTSVNGVNGWKFINKSDSDLYIFLPAASDADNPTDNVEAHYWASSFSSSWNCYAYELRFYIDEELSIHSDLGKCNGFSIRPVSPKLKTIHSVGIGESDGDHRNALEITTDGSIFVKGVGDYDGSNPQSGKSLQLLLLNISGGEAGLAPETAIVIAAALNDLNDRINAIPQSQP